MLNGVELWYKVAGEPHPQEAPLLFLHGGPGYNSYSFKETIGAQLQEYVQMIYLDERGSGRSERPTNRDYSMATLVQDVEALRSSLGLPKLSLMGHSFGGAIALEYASRYPQHVDKLIIVDGLADMPATSLPLEEANRRRYPTAWRSTIDGSAGALLKRAVASGDTCALAKAEFDAEMATLQNVDAQAFRDWEQFRNQSFLQEQRALNRASGLRNTGELSAAYFGKGSDFPCYRFTDFKRLTMPALIMVGKYDGAVGVEQMRKLAARLPYGQFDDFRKSGHFVYAEEPSKFVTDVVRFLDPMR